MGSNRRTFLASLGAAGVLTACGGGKMIGESPNGGGSASTADNLFRPHQSTFLPLEIVNKTGYPDSEIWFYTVGQKTPTQPAWYHITDAKTGALAQCVQSDIKGGFVDYSLNLATGTTNGNMMLPTMNGGCRMYFSVGKKLKIPAGSAPNFVPGSPSGWSPGQANYDTLFDWWEFVNIPADSTQGFNPNTTQVDMLGLPMKITAIGKDTPSQGVSGGFPTGARTKIFNALKANKDFAKLIIGGAKGDLRAVAPNVAIPIGFMSKTYLDQYIDQVWKHFASTGKNKLKAITSQGTVIGTVDAQGRFVFTGVSPDFWFVKPSTLDVFANQVLPMCGAGKACPPPAPPKYIAPSELQGALAPAINRTTLLTSGNELGIATVSAGCKDSLKTKFQNSITNYYAKYIHENAIDGKAYAFGNDDNCSDSSFIVSRKPTKGVITLQPF